MMGGHRRLGNEALFGAMSRKDDVLCYTLERSESWESIQQTQFLIGGLNDFIMCILIFMDITLV
jgi:hypothetical protein